MKFYGKFNLFKLFKRKKKEEKPLLDIDGNPLQEGEKVEAQRYELGLCKLIIENDQYFYESLESGKKIHWTKMIDAITERQKVKKSDSLK